MTKIIIIGLSIFTFACSKTEFSAPLQNVNDGILQKTDKPACEVDPTDFIVHPQIQSYDVISKKGGSFGFNLITGIFKAFGLNFKTEKGQVWVTTSFYSPMNYNSSLSPAQNSAFVIGDKTAEASDKEFRADIDIAQFSTGFSYYNKTPFATLTRKGLVNATEDALQRLSSLQTRWKTVVAEITPSYAIIPTGTQAGVLEGDEFVFYNVTYAWEGEPCGKFLMPVPTTSSPIAKGRVIRTEAYASAVEVTSLNPDEKIEVGSQVEVSKLVHPNPNEKRSLLRSVKVIDMTPAPVPVEGSAQTVDFSVFANIQFRSMLRDYGFYIRN